MIARLAPSLLLALATPAHAELTICNRTSYLMDAAFGLEKRAKVSTRGWFRIDPGQCRKVLDGALDADMVYVHARTPPLYGSAPLPQNGQAELCIRAGDFTMADARACPVSQQAPFSAARPSDTPKGPTVNLAEEADYDGAQAQLAGVQRLLTIAGYDAYPDRRRAGRQDASRAGALPQGAQSAADAAASPEFFDTLLKAAQDPAGVRLFLVQRHPIFGDGRARRRRDGRDRHARLVSRRRRKMPAAAGA